LHDELQPLARLMPADCGGGFLEALDWAMAVRPQSRPQSVMLWRDVLEGRVPVPSRARQDATRPGVTMLNVAPSPDYHPTLPMHTAPPGSVAANSELWRGFTVPGGVPMVQPAPRAVASGPPAVLQRDELVDGAARSPRQRPAWLVGTLVGCALLGLAAAFAWRAPVAVAPQAAASAPVVAAQGPASAVAVAPAPSPAPPAASAPVVVAAEPMAAVASAPAAVAPVAVVPRNLPPASAQPGPPPRTQVAQSTARSREHRRREREAAASKAVAVASPSERCADHSFLTRWLCVRRECDSDPRLRHHAECVRLQKAEEEQREQRERMR
jgi:hypothetical protein